MRRTRLQSAGRPGWWRLSLRARLLSISMALLLTGLTISGAVVLTTLRGHLVDRVDTQLRPFATLLSRLPPAVFANRAGGAQSTGLGRGLDLISATYVAFLAPDGTVEQAVRLPRDVGTPEPALPRLDAAATATRHGG
ncbi:hypothetical protein ACFQ0D_32705, partial [Micromonospora zhanjiangensis]